MSGGKSVHVLYRLFIYALLLGIQLLREVDCDPIHRFFFIIFFCVFNVTFSNISAILWRPILAVEEAGVPGENHRPWASNW